MLGPVDVRCLEVDLDVALVVAGLDALDVLIPLGRGNFIFIVFAVSGLARMLRLPPTSLAYRLPRQRPY